MTKFVIHARVDGPAWHRQFVEAFRDGLKGHDITVTGEDDAKKGTDRVHVIFGPNYFPHAYGRADKKLTVNRCFFGNEKTWVAIGWNGWNGFADFRNEGSPPDRFEKYRELFPKVKLWPRNGGYSIMIGEYPSACDRPSMIEQFYGWAGRADPKLMFRPHPHHKQIPKGMVRCNASLEGAQWIFSFASTFGVDLALQGAPMVCHPASAAYPMAAGLIEFDQWRHNLAYAQWNIDEIRSGEFWEHLKDAD